VPFKLSLQLTGATHSATISWDSVIGKKYQVQSKADLTAAWTDLSPAMTAADHTLTATDNSPTTMKFYRVLLLP